MKKPLHAMHLKLLAMSLMLCDHLWATIVSGAEWLTCLGRLAFPIFAFQIAEGYACTSDKVKYRRRVLLWAAISELPFNLMTGGGLINPFHQNVMFTFWLSLLILGRIDRARERSSTWGWLCAAAWMLAGFLLGFVTMVDYYGYGIVMVVLFHMTRKARWGQLIQLAVMYWLNVEMMGGLVYPVMLFGREWLIHQQGFALFALIPIWLYNGEHGPYNKTIRRVCYAFYPVHILVLALVGMFVLN